MGTHLENHLDAVEIHGTLPDFRVRLTLAQIEAIEQDPRFQKDIAADYGINVMKVHRIKRRALKMGRKVG